MRKTICFLTLLMLMSGLKAIAQSMTVNNTSSCNVWIKVAASDPSYGSGYPCAGKLSNTYYLAAGTSVTFTNVADINAGTYGFTWMGGGSVAVSGSNWNDVVICNNSTCGNSSCNYPVGDYMNCPGRNMTASTANPCPCQCSATWSYPLGYNGGTGNDILVTIF